MCKELMSYNSARDGLTSPGTGEALTKLIPAVNPDIICFPGVVQQHSGRGCNQPGWTKPCPACPGESRKDQPRYIVTVTRYIEAAVVSMVPVFSPILPEINAISRWWFSVPFAVLRQWRTASQEVDAIMSQYPQYENKIREWDFIRRHTYRYFGW